jgi:hypothetical protein
MFRVDPKTVTQWAKAGKLTSIRNVGALLPGSVFYARRVRADLAALVDG